MTHYKKSFLKISYFWMGVGFRLAPQGYVFTPVYLIALLWMLLSSMELMSIVDTSVTVVNVVVDTADVVTPT